MRGLAPAPPCLLRQRAERLLRAGDTDGAEQALSGQTAPAAALLRARLAISKADVPAAHAALAAASRDANLLLYTTLERGRLALVESDPALAASQLGPIAATEHFWAPQAALPLARALAASAPEHLLAQQRALAAKLALAGAGAQSELTSLVADAQRRLGHAAAACETDVHRFVHWPMAKQTPELAPACRALTDEETLARIDRLAEANRNDAAQGALDAFALASPNDTSAPLGCRRAFVQGVVARKRRRYAQAEAAFDRSLALCHDEAIVRRAKFTRAKVISIQDGLRAIAPIEQFAREYGSHSMVDDVLFWAGDSLQRRGRDAEASAYYRRILALPRPDDQCIEAGWRLAWMAYRRGDTADAAAQLRRSLSGRCAHEPWTKARTHYWLGRIAQADKQAAQAKVYYRAATLAAPLHYYAQSALAQWAELEAPAARKALLRRFALPKPLAAASAPCPSTLSSHPAFAEGLYLLQHGLHDEARAAFMRVNASPKLFAWERPAPLRQCGRRQAVLLLCALLEQSGAFREARARLYSEFGRELASWPTTETLPAWQRAYPLAFREPLASAETESALPRFLLQALAREESTFDPEVVSWAEAGGLTQLLLSSGQLAGRSLKPPVLVHSLDQLLEPYVNARLGGALLGFYGRRLAGSWPLALASYNGGHDVARAWWKRFGGGELAVFGEEMTVRETRMYVQRVLQTLGIYRWLYAGLPPTLAAPPRLPPFAPGAGSQSDPPIP